MAIVWSNNASTSVAGAGVTSVDTSVQLAAGTGALFPNPVSGNYYVATFYDQATKTRNEIVHVTAMSGDVATIVRAQEGTTAQAWSQGDIFANLITAGTLAAFVQAGTGPVSTEYVYVATDTGTTNHIVGNTVPSFSAYATGMLINVLVKNGNGGPTDAQFNGLAVVPVTRNNGAALVGGDLTASQEITLVYNGNGFDTPLADIKHPPPVTTFYVRPGGNDNNTGWYNDDADAFATVYGAMYAIKSRYASQNIITIRVADGYYTGGFSDDTSYVAGWSILGNVGNPTAVTIDATSTNPPVNSNGEGACVSCGGSSKMEVAGFMFRSYNANVHATGGTVTLHDNHYTTSTGATTPVCIWASGSSFIYVNGVNTFDNQGLSMGALIAVTSAGIELGSYGGVFGTTACTINIVGNPTVQATMIAEVGGAIGVQPGGAVSWTGGTPQGPKYKIDSGAGIITYGNTGQIPGSQPGIVDAASFGWIS